MARARFIRPEFFTDEKIGNLPMEARLLYACIWCHSDLRGVFEYSAKQLRVFAFPYDEAITRIQIQDWLTLLEQIGVVGQFLNDGKTWGYVIKWIDHQKVSGREKESGSIRPFPPGMNQAHPNMSPGTPKAATLTLTSSLSPTPAPTLALAVAPAQDNKPRVLEPLRGSRLDRERQAERERKSQ